MKQAAQTFSSVFDALADTPQEAANKRARAEQAQALAALPEINALFASPRQRVFLGQL